MSKDTLITMEESKKYETISRVIKKEITQRTASQILQLTVRQIRNLTKGGCGKIPKVRDFGVFPQTQSCKETWSRRNNSPK